MPRWVVVLVLVGCGGGSATPPDAGIPDATQVDTPPAYAACREFSVVGNTLPAHVMGSLSAADVESPQCAAVDAPYGIESAGPDSVIALDGLEIGEAYIVRLQSPADLAFYVATGCSTANGPAPAECPLFVDAVATGGEETGRFIATTTREYIVVDYYASAMPQNQTFTLDVYAEACADNTDCGGGLPVCKHGRCVQCGDSFDCTDGVLSRCDTGTNTCAAGIDTCTTEDASEPSDDGPAGAFQFFLDDAGNASTTSEICSSPRTEADFYSFQVTTVGETWDITLSWSGNRDLDLDVYDATGTELGMSYWERPEGVRLSYLPIGTYYIRVTDFGQTATPVGYSLAVHRDTGAGCTTRADCAAEYRNQLFRGDCQAGACIPLAGGGAVASGGACDSVSDCTSGLSCPSFFFVQDAHTRDVCAPTCATDTDCASLGAGYVCTTFLIQNLCVQKCTTDEQCPIDVDAKPASGPWYRLRCQTSSGKCVP